MLFEAYFILCEKGEAKNTSVPSTALMGLSTFLFYLILSRPATVTFPQRCCHLRFFFLSFFFFLYLPLDRNWLSTPSIIIGREGSFLNIRQRKIERMTRRPLTSTAGRAARNEKATSFQATGPVINRHSSDVMASRDRLHRQHTHTASQGKGP